MWRQVVTRISGGRRNDIALWKRSMAVLWAPDTPVPLPASTHMAGAGLTRPAIYTTNAASIMQGWWRSIKGNYAFVVIDESLLKLTYSVPPSLHAFNYCAILKILSSLSSRFGNWYVNVSPPPPSPLCKQAWVAIQPEISCGVAYKVYNVLKHVIGYVFSLIDASFTRSYNSVTKFTWLSSQLDEIGVMNTLLEGVSDKFAVTL